MNQKLNKIPTNKKHIIKHIIREKCTKIGCCADIDHRIKTHKINKNDITYGNIILSKDMFNLLRTHVKTDTSQQISQQIEQFQRFVFMSNFPLSFSLRCRHCSLDIKSKYIYSNIISNCWFLSYGSKCMSSMILSNSRLDKSRFYIDDKYTYYKNLIKIKISLTLLEVLNVDLIHLKCDNKNINIRIDAFNAIRGLYIEYQKRDEGIFIKNINKNNKIEELIGLHSNDIFNITPDKFKFLKMIHIYRYDISRHVFFNYLIKIAHYFYQFPLINFILCNHESIFKHRDEIKKYIYTNTSNNHMFSLLSTKSIS